MCVPCIIPGMPRGGQFRHEPGLILAHGTNNRRVLEIRARERTNFGVQRNDDLEAKTMRQMMDQAALSAAGRGIDKGKRSKKLDYQQQPDHNPLRREGSEASSRCSTRTTARRPDPAAPHLLGVNAGQESAYVGSHQPPVQCEMRDMQRLAGLSGYQVTGYPIDHEIVVPAYRAQPWTFSNEMESTVKSTGPVPPKEGLPKQRRHYDTKLTKSRGTRQAMKGRASLSRPQKEEPFSKDMMDEAYFWARDPTKRMRGEADFTSTLRQPGFFTQSGAFDNTQRNRKRYTVGSADGVALASRPPGDRFRSPRQEGVPQPASGLPAAGIVSDKHDMCRWWRKHDADYTPREADVDPSSGLHRTQVRAYSADARLRRPSEADFSTRGGGSPATLSAPLTARAAVGQQEKDGKGGWQRKTLFTLGAAGREKIESETRCAYSDFQYPASECLTDAASLPSSRTGSSLRTSRSTSCLSSPSACNKDDVGRLSRSGSASGANRRQGCPAKASGRRVAPGTVCPAPSMRRSASEASSRLRRSRRR
eukprot:TRINITY_DN84256_c0_g1_i1.p1 TRINITY_DN84256_c0_g1~~TRINITY_DN84256_c0_g1_i1.p1  ORF type:complete len:535 (+),score=45.96 TRINITY_DN84256_c0_g1_i1:73-1677(+)